MPEELSLIGLILQTGAFGIVIYMLYLGHLDKKGETERQDADIKSREHQAVAMEKLANAIDRQSIAVDRQAEGSDAFHKACGNIQMEYVKVATELRMTAGAIIQAAETIAKKE